jgi:divalent metal cation (Fe/Co/Zn/Cd) transporter
VTAPIAHGGLGGAPVETALVLLIVADFVASNLGALAAAGVIGCAGNELAAQVRLRAGRRLASPALISDGNHARIDAFVSLGVLASAAAVWLGAEIADPIVGLLITLVILKITWDSWRIVKSTDPGDLREAHEH